MAISMSGAEVDTSQRDALLGSNVNGSVTAGNETANTKGWFNPKPTGAALAGVTANFAGHVCAEIDDYIRSITGHIDAMVAAQSNVAFQGEGVSGALQRFITAVQAVANDYANRLKGAEQQIINSVQEVYTAQDSHLSGELSSDAGGLQNSNQLFVRNYI